VPFNPGRVRYGEWGAALIAIAGPLTNFLLAFILFGVLVISGVGYDTLFGTILITAVSVNLGFFIFNILPIPPLDGSRVLYALAPEFVRRGMEVMERYGLLLVFALVLLASPLLGSFMRGTIGFFIDIFSTVFRLT
jgi:Zn-dependent protease